ncbi:MAG TPA: PEGA domain-containing protein, partial [Polyangia bacterium]|nr:PEGA domain-containing protein [Polyangia bacterium]
EIKLVFGCSDEAPACMAQAGKSLGAAKLLFGSIKRLGGDPVITLKLLDVSRAVVESSMTEAIVKRRADAATIRPLTAKWITRLSGKPGTGSLAVRANVAGASVSLDGVVIGTTGDKPVAVTDVAVGKHEVSVEKSGFTRTRQEFSLAAGQSLPLSLSLSPLSLGAAESSAEPVAITRPGDDTGDGADDSSRTLARVGFWTALVGASVSAALALKFGNDVRRINRELDTYRRYSCDKSASGLCDDQGNVAIPLTPQMTLDASRKTDEGNHAQTLQWVFVAMVPPFAIAGAYLLYKGYLEGDGDSKTSHNRGPRIFPTASASAGGIVAEFDF